MTNTLIVISTLLLIGLIAALIRLPNKIHKDHYGEGDS